MFCRVLMSILLTAALAFATTANAEWLEASSDHFVVYGEQNEDEVRAFAKRLERFHAAMGQVFAKPQTRPGPSNRVTIFVVSSRREVREVLGTRNRFLAGQYIPRAGASVAVVPRMGRASQYELSGEKILYHEYAHHFMAGLTARAYPRWFSEGFAEFFSGVRFEEDGSILLGTPAAHRAGELMYALDVPIRRLLSFDGGASDPAPRRYDSFYGQSWVLFHYLQMAPERKGQLIKYQQLLATGQPALAAAEGAFGDLDQLDKDMGRYMNRRRLSAMVVNADALAIGPITLRKLRPGEAAMLPTMMESKVGVSDEEAKSLVPEARKVAARYPDDAAVLAALAEVEFDAGNDDAAIAAADRALAIDPKQINAHIQKGYALAHKVESGALPKEAWKDVRGQFIKANAVENDHPIPLVHFYLSYLEQGEAPTQNAIDGLEWAMQLAPFDGRLRWLVAQQMIRDQRYQDAARTLTPLAYSPHPGEHTDNALKLLKDVEARMGAESAPDSPKAQ
jgi:cytochrome c-type biogenesis protein CcmH/NrfG